ncbi:hypothetical protein DFQ28_002081 [Apophysomyces sp. BC1034]|nr:hypothetical protein DFQ30_002490 [Apophysomyces sp. BC1015]KAG0179873.1 hypothetical protein DFQ29_001526 [Apophysomyces sp. BC1021]KAG0190412.1 hypothetical protein DFQ28_002081 [Apophysomyces sp. BC1034]
MSISKIEDRLARLEADVSAIKETQQEIITLLRGQPPIQCDNTPIVAPSGDKSTIRKRHIYALLPQVTRPGTESRGHRSILKQCTQLVYARLYERVRERIGSEVPNPNWGMVTMDERVDAAHMLDDMLVKEGIDFGRCAGSWGSMHQLNSLWESRYDTAVKQAKKDAAVSR